jgi:hypothetical protein
MTSVFARVVVLGLLAFASSTRVTPQQQEPMSPPLLPIQTSSFPPDWIFNSNPHPLPLPPNAAEPRLGVSAGSQEKVCISAGHPPRPASACPTASEQGGLYLVSDGISDPRPTSTPAPMYSIDTRTKKPQGTLVLWMVVAQNGRPMDVRVAVSLEKGLDRDAANAGTGNSLLP